MTGDSPLLISFRAGHCGIGAFEASRGLTAGPSARSVRATDSAVCRGILEATSLSPPFFLPSLSRACVTSERRHFFFFMLSYLWSALCFIDGWSVLPLIYAMLWTVFLVCLDLFFFVFVRVLLQEVFLLRVTFYAQCERTVFQRRFLVKVVSECWFHVTLWKTDRGALLSEEKFRRFHIHWTSLQVFQVLARIWAFGC